MGDSQEIATRLGQGVQKVENILQFLQSFDPIGIFAKDLQQCLTTQLKAKNRFNPAMAKLLIHLRDLAKYDFTKLKRICAVNDDDLLDMLNEIHVFELEFGLVVY